MVRFGENSLATLEFVLRRQDGAVEHEEHYLARRVNVWRDIFPAGLVEALTGKTEGDSVFLEYGPGELVPAFNDRLTVEIPRKCFCSRLRSRNMEPRVGRFYPLGMISVPGSFPQSIAPFRVLNADGATLVVDRNHPMAKSAVTLEARLIQVEDKRSETGGSLHHWMEEICNYGPGMQDELPGRNTDFFDPDFFERSDSSPDSRFYSAPRIIGHIDAGARTLLKDQYARFLSPGMRVLDLMSSIHSHLPEDMSLEVTGLGMNMEEMEANPALARRVVHDLNVTPELPDSIGTFEAAICSLSIEYLTDPVSVLSSVREHLRPGGTMLVGVSNRWFPTKTVTGWVDLHEFERMGLIHELLRRAGFQGPASDISVRNWWRDPEDPHYLETRGVGDPVYVVRTKR